MRVLLINTVCGIRSTGRICTDIAEEFVSKGAEVKIAYGRDIVPKEYKKYSVRIGSKIDVALHAFLSRIFDCSGLLSKMATRKFLQKVEKFSPDLIWLHNIHGYYINYELLFSWIKKHPEIKIKWTLHDCWAFTGHCTHFTMVKCNKWEKGCEHCPQKNRYPSSFLFDNSFRNYERKKKAYQGIKNMTLIAPSQWLADLLAKSFLKEYTVEVHYNTINKNIFKPTPSDIRKKYAIGNKKIILGVASGFDIYKGFNDFLKLSKIIDAKTVIVLVGVSDRQIKKLPKNIIGIKQTNDIEELARLYTAADVFVNLSKEETFGLTTLEAISCGTEAIVYKGTACEEVVKKYGGVAVPQNINCIYNAIRNVIYNEDNK